MDFRKSFQFCLLAILIAKHAAAFADDHFEKRVKPILQSKCLGCHNADDRKGDLVLDYRSGFLTGGESGSAIDLKRPELSHLLEMVTPVDGKAAMPKGAAPLSEDEIESLRLWVVDGAKWSGDEVLQTEVWWSLRPLVRPTVPEVTGLQTLGGTLAAQNNPIDAFIQQGLQQRGLKPSPQADRRTLARRVYADVIGLPATPEEIQKFVDDPDPKAYEKLVDRLLAMPQYGEKWGRHWLDVVRYADTCGYDKDKLRRNAWPYRDYVIRSFNEDKQYSRFVQEQVAGDVLFPGTKDGILGLGFIVAGPWDFIGHVEVSESKIDGQIARSLDRDEMVTGTLNAFSSTTVQCARCHDHKFDPITQKHYYGLQAVFAAVDRADRAYFDSASDQDEYERLVKLVEDSNRERMEVEQQIQAAYIEHGEDSNVSQRQKELRELEQTRVDRPVEYGYHSQISDNRLEEKWVQIDLNSHHSLTRVVVHPCDDDYNDIGPGFGFPERFRIEFASDLKQFEEGDEPEFVIDQSQADFQNPKRKAVEFFVGLDDIRWVRFTATQLAPRSGDFILALAELEVFDSANQNLARQGVLTASDHLEAPVRWSLRNLNDGLSPVMGLAAIEKQLSELRASLAELEQRCVPKELLSRRDALSAASIRLDQQQKEMLNKRKMVYAAATEFPNQGEFRATRGISRDVRVLNRGNVTEPLELAIPGTIPVVAGVPVEFELTENHLEGERRAALARWLVREDNSLTWRSIVNRVWLFHFGSGLVSTPNDFGRMGMLPTHPELLDWLAVEFRDDGQSFKKLHRLILTSSTYQQASANDEANAEIDASNQSLWRMNRRRLDAEELRDAILAVSGKLNLEMGGPGFFLFDLEKEEHSPHYEYHTFDPSQPESHRRSVYRFVVRSQPDPFMTTLDCADSSQSTPQRMETVTALQALAMLNNKFNLAMSEAFAVRLNEVSPDESQKIQHGFQLVTGRTATPEELEQLTSFSGEFGLPSLCRLLFNLNEFSYID
ncbi:PSD1 and planctomycete cytochrome C domain-containing protein [Planctomicrobium sp. SH668]|uniref:PSD1 and planctomycete cytochrome C domain-containing protein n=1 Tax=Planctomicrobium sp. SH668 TaxID=3448126 RepID=UPI003F5B3495